MEVPYKTIHLSYFTCNTTTMISSLVILPIMVMTILIIKLFVVSDIYKQAGKCSPLSYYFGEKIGCRNTIYKSVNIENFASKTSESIDFRSALRNYSGMILNMNEYIKQSFYNYLVKLFSKKW